MDWGKAFVSQAFDKLFMECQALQHTFTLVVTTVHKLSSFLFNPAASLYPSLCQPGSDNV
jgi:hypothetical protein